MAKPQPTSGSSGSVSSAKSSFFHKSSSDSNGKLSYKAILTMALLALQFGIQPIVTRHYTSKNIIKSTVIFMQEVIKLVMSVVGIWCGKSSWSDVTAGWTFQSWSRLAFLPALIYLVQNMCSLVAYQNLDAITYNVLNQTKTLSAALCCYLLLHKKQSLAQIAALFLLLLSALIMEGVLTVGMLLPSYWTSNESNRDSNRISSQHFSRGVLPILAASLLSGLAGAITQKSLQTGNRNALLFTMELCAASIFILLGSFISSQDGYQIRHRGFFAEWELSTLIPIATNSVGGILVGLVIKYAGTVRKGFALIFGILISGVFQSVLEGKSLSREDVVGGFLAALSLWMHSANPHSAVQKQTKHEKIHTARKTVVMSNNANKVARKGRRKSRKED